MKPETKALLNEIGYQQALLCNRSLMFWSWAPSAHGGNLFKNKTEAGECRKSISDLEEALRSVPERLLELIESEARSSEDWDNGRSPLVDVVCAIGAVRDMSEREYKEKWKGRGPSPKLAAQDTAVKLAEIYVLGRGEMPGSGATHEGDPSGHFPKFVERFFGLEGIDANFRAACKHAIKWLKADNKREFKRLISMRERKGRKAPLVDSR